MMNVSSNVMAGGGYVAFFGELRKHWGWLLALGIVDVILGTIGLGMLFLFTIVSVMVYGIFLLFSGALQVMQAAKSKHWKGVLIHVAMALLYLVAGAIILKDPVLASSILTLILGVAILAGGLFRSILALQHRDKGHWGWVLFGGILSMALGGMILAQWPMTGLWVIGLIIAIDLIFQGWSCIALALAAKSGSSDRAQFEGAR